MNNKVIVVLLACGIFGATNVLAEEASGAQSPSMNRMPLIEVLDSVRQQTGRTFVVDVRVHPQLVVGQLAAGEIDYHSLLVVLRNNGLAAIKAGELTTVIPTAYVRQQPLPVLHEDDPTIDDEEWITRVIKVHNTEAAQLVPIFRPLLPQAGHMAAHMGSNTLTIVDRAGNARRVAELVRTVDREAKQ